MLASTDRPMVNTIPAIPGSVKTPPINQNTPITNSMYKSKFIPVSQDGLNHIHYQGGKDVVALYLMMNPGSKMFDGKGLILGGSHSPNYNVANSLVILLLIK
jgi:hypothetical protein